MPKAVAIVLWAVGATLVGVAAYFAWNVIRTGTFLGVAESPAVVERPEESFALISAGPVLAYFPRSDGVIVLKENGEITLVLGTTESVLSSASSDVPFRASISFDKRYLLVGFGPREFPQFSIYDTARDVWLPLRVNGGTEPVADAVWAPDGLRVAFLEATGDDWSLGTMSFPDSAPDGGLSDPTVLRRATLSLEDARLVWVAPEKLYLTSIPSAFDRGFLMEFDLASGALRSLIAGEAGLSLRWREDGEAGVKFSLRGQTASLDLVDGSARTLAPIPLRTLPEKCAFDEAFLYCAVFSHVPERTQLPDDYYQKMFAAHDVFLQFSLEERAAAELPIISTESLDATRLTVSEQELFFVNDRDKRLYRLPL